MFTRASIVVPTFEFGVTSSRIGAKFVSNEGLMLGAELATSPRSLPLLSS